MKFIIEKCPFGHFIRATKVITCLQVMSWNLISHTLDRQVHLFQLTWRETGNLICHYIPIYQLI